MFAVIKSGGKQYKAKKDQIIKVEKIEAELGQEIEIKDVLMVSDSENTLIGSPYIVGATVTATVVEHSRNAKIIVFKKQRRQHYRRKNGHKQHITHLLIKDIKQK